MIRSAAKNYKDVTIIVDVADYDTIIEKLKNNEWYLTPDGFTVIFAHDELTSYALGTITSTIPWNIAEEYLK